MTKNICQRW